MDKDNKFKKKKLKKANVVITKNLYNVAVGFNCFWLISFYAAHLSSLSAEKQPFTHLNLTVKKGTAIARIEDGNDSLLHSVTIEYIDFPACNFSLFGCWDGDSWVIMLPEDY